MSTALRLLAPYLIALLVGAVAAWTIQEWRWGLEVASIQLSASEQQTAAVAAARAEEHRMQEQVDAADHQGAVELADIVVSFDNAGSDAVRLRDEAEALRRRYTTENSRLATKWASAAQTVAVLTGLLEDADGQAELLTGAYENARSRGLTCERSYDALTAGAK